MKEYIGLSFKQRFSIFIRLFKLSFLCLFQPDVDFVLIVKKMFDNIVTILSVGIMPSKELVRAEVDKKPYEPFGVPGMKTTIKPGDLVERYGVRIGPSVKDSETD